VLSRHGLSRRRAQRPRQTFRRYEWAQPGALLHMDTKRLDRFDKPGHWATGERSEKIRTRGSGHIYVHCVVDEHSRLAYAECHTADSAPAAAATLERAIAWFISQGCQAPEAVMTDNALVYRRSHALAALLAHHNARHILTPPFTPHWNGKVERFIQTLDNEWAKSRTWPNHHAEIAPCHRSCATTTAGGHTAASATGPPSAAFTTSKGRTPRRARDRA
jgi:transposase InsO family protein